MYFFLCVHRVDHLYTFFVQWSPDMYTKGNKKHHKSHYLIREKHQKHYLVVEKNKAAITKILNNPVNPTAKNWEVRLAHKQRIQNEIKNICGFQTASLRQDNEHHSVESKPHQVPQMIYSNCSGKVLGNHPAACGKSHRLYIWTSFPSPLPPSILLFSFLFSEKWNSLFNQSGVVTLECATNGIS